MANVTMFGLSIIVTAAAAAAVDLFPSSSSSSVDAVTEHPLYKALLSKYESERRGRIKKEIEFRNHLKASNPSSTKASAISPPDTLRMVPIGRITTPFKKRTGCPRQPALCPSSLATLTLTCANASSCASGLSSYSHAWVIFTFDANTDLRQTAADFKAKITPPRIEPRGSKVGCLSTRTPHRPNNVGLSLMRILKVEGATLTLANVDLCDRTPVYDVKPFVPWDVPEYVSGGRWPREMREVVRAPEWVWDDEAKGLADDGAGIRRVEWKEEAREGLEVEHARGTFNPLYHKKDSASLDRAKSAIEEVLVQDPRHNR